MTHTEQQQHKMPDDSTEIYAMVSWGQKEHETEEESNYFVFAYTGMVDAAKLLGSNIRVEWHGPNAWNPVAEANTIRTLIGGYVDGIIVSAADKDALNSAIGKAVTAGIPVITFDADAPASERLTFVGTNNYEAGYLAGKTMAGWLQGTGDVAISTMANADHLNERVAGFQAALSEYVPNSRTHVMYNQQGMSIGEDGRSDSREARSNYINIMKSNPGIRGLFATFANQGEGAAAAVEELQLQEKVQILAFDFDEETTRLIAEGKIRATVGQDPYYMGYVSMILAYYARHAPEMPSKHEGAWRIIALTEFLRDHPDLPKNTVAKLMQIVSQLNASPAGLSIQLDTGAEILGKDELLRILARNVRDMRDSIRDKIVALSAEIEDHKKAKEALAFERDLLQTMMDNSPDYLFFKDRESRFIRTNKAHAQLLLGLKGAEEAIGKTDFDLFAKEEAQRFFDEEQHIMESQQPVVAREWSLHSSTTGEVVWLSEHKLPITNKTGNVIGLLGVSRDVTARKQMEAALAREQEMLQTLMDSSPDYLFFKDRESRFIRTNKAHAQLLLGLSGPEEAVGKTDFDLFAKEEAQRFFDEEQRIMETKQPVVAREWSLTSSTTGEVVWLSEHKIPITDKTRQVVGLLGISRDVTRQKQAEEALKKAHAKLEERAIELAAAYEEIRILNTQLQEENLRMSAELNVARRLQEMILPPPEELQQIEGLDIVGYMKPADEVGGDYYDVLKENGMLHIGIGDVTGHGLESGVLMLMTQTVIRTLIEHGETDPIAFVNTLNRTIYKNAQRMKADKTLTFALVNYEDRQVKIVGQHEDMLVVRKNGQVELVDTLELGFPIGLEAEITQWVASATVSLGSGDGIVLYTDGITEAANLQDELYGLERLCEVISQHWERSAEETKQAIVDDVIRHIGEQKVYDDLTLVVLKQS